MSAPQLHLRSGPSTTTQPSQISTSTRIEVAGTLRLRGVSAEGRRIRWAEDVVDNEGMGRKSSKVCCIYHSPRAVGESSSDSSSSDSDSDSEPDNSTAKTGGKRKNRRQHDHDHDHACVKEDELEKSAEAGEGPEALAKAKGKGKGSRQKRSPNAYEKMPKVSGTQTMVEKP